MRISSKFKQDLIKCNLNFPIDGRTKSFKEQVQRFALPELYKLQRYKTDPEYAEKMRKRAIDNYYKKKEERQNTAK